MADNLILDDSIKTSDAILGTLEGPCADFITPTRNNHGYGEELWEKTFNDPIVQEMLDAGGIPGELDHPTDREETDSSRIAILLRNKPDKRKDGKLWAKFDILNTPLGKIAYTLAKAGFKLGISSRGTGDVYTDENGVEQVEADTYDFKAFDLVLLPAVKAARLNLITEGLSKSFDYKKALTEALDTATADDRQVMVETLNHLDIHLDNYTPNTGDNLIIDESMNKKSVDNNEDILVNELKKAIQENKDLSLQITQLQEKLSVCYTKEIDLETSVLNGKRSIKKLTEQLQSARAIETKHGKLQEEFTSEKKHSEQLASLVEALQSKLNQSSMKKKELDETIAKLNTKLSECTATINKLTLADKQYQQEIISVKNSCQDKLQESLKNSEIKQHEYSKKITESNKLVEKYKRVANAAVSRLIESQAKMIGISAQEIINKLPKNYSFDDIDRICEDLRNYKASMNKLPFSLTNNSQSKITITESKDSLVYNEDDEVDSALLNLLT